MSKRKSFHSKIQKWLYLFLGTSITVILLSWALKDVAWISVWDIFRQANWLWLVFGWFAYVASYCVRAKRWGTLLSATNNPGRFRTRLAGIFIGFGANSVLPAFMGEFLRATVPYRLDKVPFGASIGSVFAERLLDIGVVFLFLLIPLWLSVLSSHPDLSNLPISQLGFIIVLIWFVFLLGASFPSKVSQIIGSLSRKVGLGRFESHIVSVVTDFLRGLSALKNPQRSFTALIETVIIWSLNAITFWAGLVAFDLVKPGILGALFIQSISALAITIPSTPGYVGTFEASIRFALGIYDVSAETAIAYGIALRFIMLITIPIIAGFIAISTGMINWNNLYINEEKLK